MPLALWPVVPRWAVFLARPGALLLSSRFLLHQALPVLEHVEGELVPAGVWKRGSDLEHLLFPVQYILPVSSLHDSAQWGTPLVAFFLLAPFRRHCERHRRSARPQDTG